MTPCQQGSAVSVHMHNTGTCTYSVWLYTTDSLQSYTTDSLQSYTTDSLQSYTTDSLWSRRMLHHGIARRKEWLVCSRSWKANLEVYRKWSRRPVLPTLFVSLCRPLYKPLCYMPYDRPCQSCPPTWTFRYFDIPSTIGVRTDTCLWSYSTDSLLPYTAKQNDSMWSTPSSTYRHI